MDMIRTTDLKSPPKHISVSGGIQSTAPLIELEEWATLAQAGIYRYVTAEGPAPLGYTEWELRQDAAGRDYYYREPAGTQEERDAAALQLAREQQEITALQGELQLLATPDPSGQFANAYEAVMAWAETQDAETQAFFRRQPTWSRMSPIILAGAQAFGWSAEDLDNLFAAAAQR